VTVIARGFLIARDMRRLPAWFEKLQSRSQKKTVTMADGRAQMSRVQRELLELKQRGRVKTQADKLKDCKLNERSSIPLLDH
jgi:hypothetical protein